MKSEKTEGREIISALAVAIRTAQVHDAENASVTSAIERLLSTVNPLVEEYGSVTVQLYGDFFYINGSRVKYSVEFLLNGDFLSREYKKRGIGNLIIHRMLRMDDMRLFLQSFKAGACSADPYAALSEGIKGLESIEITPYKETAEMVAADIKKVVRMTYFNAVSVVRELINKIKAGEKIRFKRVKRVVEHMVDLMLNYEELLFGMASIKNYKEYTCYHMVNVSILSIAQGQRLGMSRKELTELGLVALFHDLGKIGVPDEILNKPSQLNDEEWRIIRKHPFWGLRAILTFKGIDEISIRTAITALEHHLGCDISGYPRMPKTMELDIYSKIVSIADQYDAMTASRVYSRVPTPPEKALGIMGEKTGTELDFLLFKFFVNMMGVYPIGTLVLLDSGELGLVCGCNTTLRDRPKVFIVADKEGTKISGDVIDLTEKNASGQYLRSITKTLDPNKYLTNLSEYLL